MKQPIERIEDLERDNEILKLQVANLAAMVESHHAVINELTETPAANPAFVAAVAESTEPKSE